MAGHWIKWEKGLVRKPEIMQIAAALKVSDQHAAACCMLVWEWADDITTEGIINLTADVLDKIANQPGLARAMIDVGWLVESSNCIQFPNYDRHNGHPAKARAIDAARKRADRVAKGERCRI